jgi:hypothetical protein
MPLKIDYVNQIPSTPTKIYDILDSSNNLLFEDVKITDQTVYTDEGDSFGSADINATNTQVNANTVDISDIKTILGDVTVEQLALLADVTGDIAEKTIITSDTTDTTPEVTLADNNEYIYSDDAITTLDITLASGYTAGFIAGVVFVSPASAPTVTLTNTGSYTVKTKGDGTWASLVLTPTASKTVTMIFNYDGINMNVYVSEV